MREDAQSLTLNRLPIRLKIEGEYMFPSSASSETPLQSAVAAACDLSVSVAANAKAPKQRHLVGSSKKLLGQPENVQWIYRNSVSTQFFLGSKVESFLGWHKALSCYCLLSPRPMLFKPPP